MSQSPIPAVQGGRHPCRSPHSGPVLSLEGGRPQPGTQPYQSHSVTQREGDHQGRDQSSAATGQGTPRVATAGG